VEDLSRAGFVTTQHLSEAETGAAAEAWAERWLRRLARLRFWRWDVVGADAHVTAAYQSWGRFFFMPAALATLALVAVAGLVAFIAGMPAAGAVFAAPTTHPSLLLIVYPALVVSLVLHELGHALATKHFGRDVDRCGVGLYYFAPMAFVDTSDMWLEPPARRNVVNLAGLAVNAVVAGLASLSALVVDQPVLDLALWFVALTNYATIAANLNPLLELDGYYVLMDTLDRPNLRGRALRWLGSLRPASLARPRELAKHPVELAYALAALAYIALLVWVLATVYRSVLLERLSLLLPQWAAVSLGYGLVLAAVASMVSGLFIEMRAARQT
jgi:putative peptide zinc metalloprotease protein